MIRPLFADVAPAVPLPPTARQWYTYRLPVRLQPFMMRYSSVMVPFGRRLIPGVVMRIHGVNPGRRLRDVHAVIPAVLTSEQVSLARWLAKIAQGGLGYTLRLFLPGRHVPLKPSRPVPRVRSSRRSFTADCALVDYDFTRRCTRLASLIHTEIVAGRQVAIIIPERWMALPLQTALAASTPARYAVLHAGLGVRQRSAIWHQVRDAQIDIVVGTQKVLFLPFRSLGLVVIDEESFEAHKQWDQYPRLHNMYAAKMLAHLHHASLIYTSMFPSLWLRHAIAQGIVTAPAPKPLPLAVAVIPYTVSDRVQRLTLPHILLTQLRQWVINGEKVLLFYNRRRSEFLAALLRQSGLDAPPDQLILATGAIFTQHAGQSIDRIVWLWPETYLSYPDWRGCERILLTAARLHLLLNHKRRRQLFTITRRQLVAALFERPNSQVVEELLAERRRTGYPPFSDLVHLSVIGSSAAAAWRNGVSIRQRLETRAKRAAAPAKIRGPFHSRAAAPRRASAAVHLVIAGQLPELVALYQGLPLAAAEVAPRQIV